MIGLIGLGYWGNILKKNISFDYIFDIKKELSNVDSLDELLDKSNCVFVATPFDTHYGIVKKALEKNCHVFCEKPFCRENEQVEELFELALKKNLKLHVDWIYVYNPMIQYLHQNRESLGNLYEIEINRINTEPVREDVNSAWDLMSHDLSVLYLLSRGSKLSYSNIKHISHHECKGTFSYGEKYVGSAVFENKGNAAIKETRMTLFYDNACAFIDDVEKELRIFEDVIEHINERTPLELSIEFFLENDIEDVTMNSYYITKFVTETINANDS